MADILDLRKMYALDGTGDPNAEVGSNRGMYDHLFEPGPMPTPDMSVPEESGLSAYQPETAASSRLQQLLSEYPERQDPSFARKITSMLGGLSTLGRNVNNGIDIQDKILQGPNDQRIADWEKKIRPAEVASTQENQRNVNSRTLAALEQKDRIEGRKQTETERKNKALEESRTIRDRAYAAKANGFLIKQEGDRMVATHPTTLQRVDLGPSGMMDELDKITLQNTAAQGRAETMAAGQADRAALAAETARINNENAGNQVFTEAESGKPVVVSTRAPGGPVQVPVKDATPLTRVPGNAKPSQGPDLERVRGMTAEALRRIKTDFLVMPDPKNPKSVPSLSPTVKAAAGWANYDPRQLAPESPQLKAVTAQKNLKDLLTLSLIGEMKAQSRTGATGFGQLTGRELDVLESAASRLNWAQDDVTLTQELMDIVAKLEKIMQPGPGEENKATTPVAPKFRQNKRTGEQQVSTDGGKTYQPYVKPQ